MPQSTALERMGQRERIWGEIPERQSTAFASKARRACDFQAREKRRETVANEIMAEGRRLEFNRLRFSNVVKRSFENFFASRRAHIIFVPHAPDCCGTRTACSIGVNGFFWCIQDLIVNGLRRKAIQTELSNRNRIWPYSTKLVFFAFHELVDENGGAS